MRAKEIKKKVREHFTFTADDSLGFMNPWCIEVYSFRCCCWHLSLSICLARVNFPWLIHIYYTSYIEYSAPLRLTKMEIHKKNVGALLEQKRFFFNWTNYHVSHWIISFCSVISFFPVYEKYFQERSISQQLLKFPVMFNANGFFFHGKNMRWQRNEPTSAYALFKRGNVLSKYDWSISIDNGKYLLLL